MTDPGLLTDIFVAGKSRTKGSLTFVTRNYARPSKGMMEFQGRVSRQVLTERTARLGRVGARPHAGAVSVELVFFLPRPRGGTNSAPPISQATGDIDKLTRLILDALKIGGAYTDDSVVITVKATKLWAVTASPGVHVIARECTWLDAEGLAGRAAARIAAQGESEETGY